MLKHIEINNTDNKTIGICVYESKAADHIVIIASAAGVKQTFYKKFAAYLATEGITAITFDYTGIGQSLKEHIRQCTSNVSDWGAKDLQSVIQYTAANFNAASISIIGHSIGGQLIGLAQSSQIAHKIILVAAQSGYWKFWKGKARIKMFFIWHILFPSISRLLGYMPAKKISHMENLPFHAALQWSKWCRNREYLFADTLLNNHFYHKINCPLTAFSIEGDTYAPKEAVDWLTQRYPKSEKKVIHLRSADFNKKPIGHFGFFKEHSESSLWQLVANEIKNR